MMKKVIVLLLLMTITFSLIGCKKKSDNYYYYLDLKYGDGEREKLDLYLPFDLKDKEECGLVLYIHGGAWVSGDKSGYKDEIERRVKNGTYAYAAMNYHYIDDEHDGLFIMNEIFHALEKIKETSQSEGINITKVILTGYSAGGHLSLLYAYGFFNFDPFYSPILPVAVISFSGPTNMTNHAYFEASDLGDCSYYFSMLSGHKYTKETFEDAFPDLMKVSPVNYTDHAVPTLICHGVKDTVVPYSDALYLSQALEREKIDFDFISFENSNHGLDKDPDKWDYAMNLFDEYLKRYL